MLKIRLARIGKKSQPSYRIIVQEHTISPKRGKFVEIVGNYQPSTPNKDLVVKKDRIEHWISVGAQPTDTVASLLKRREGFKDMDRYIGKRDVKAKKKKEVEEKAPVAAPVATPVAEVKSEPAPEEPAKEEAPVEEAAAPEEAPAEEAPEETEEKGSQEAPAESKDEVKPEEVASEEADAEEKAA